MLTLIGIIILLMLIFGGHSGNSNYDYEEDEIEDMFFIDMMNRHK